MDMANNFTQTQQEICLGGTIGGINKIYTGYNLYNTINYLIDQTPSPAPFLPPKTFIMSLSADRLRPVEHFFTEDERNSNYVLTNRLTGEQRKYSFADFHKEISLICLDSNVPDEIVSNFESAKSVLAYSWFFYKASTVALSFALTTVEYALRTRIEKDGTKEINGKSIDKASLYNLINFVLDRNLLNLEAFQDKHPRIQEENIRGFLLFKKT